MENKFCTNCGSVVGNEDFCTSCGAKIEKTETVISNEDNFKATYSSIVKLYDISFWVGLIALAIVALLYVTNSFKYAESFMSFVEMYDSSFIYLLIYYLIGFFGVIGTGITFFQKTNKCRYATGVIQVIILAVITISMAIMKSVYKDSYLDDVSNLLLYRMGTSYGNMLSKAIFFEIVAGSAFLFAKKIDSSSSV